MRSIGYCKRTEKDTITVISNDAAIHEHNTIQPYTVLDSLWYDGAPSQHPKPAALASDLSEPREPCDPQRPLSPSCGSNLPPPRTSRQGPHCGHAENDALEARMIERLMETTRCRTTSYYYVLIPSNKLGGELSSCPAVADHPAKAQEA